jgi:hypothetical protein
MAKRIVILLLIPALANAGAEEEAMKKAATAAYKQSGMEATLDQFLNANIPKEHKILISKMTAVITMLIDKRIYLTWDY